MDIALFDFDGTITTKESISCFLMYISNTRIEFLKRISPHLPYILMYFLGIYPNWRLKQDILGSFVKGMEVERFRAFAYNFSRDRLNNILRPEAMGRIDWHKKRGDEIVIVSAGIKDYIEPWANQNGIRYVIAVDLEVINGKMTGRLNGENCYGREKVRRIKERFDLNKYKNIYAYGDTKGDKEMLAIADYAFYKFRPLL